MRQHLGKTGKCIPKAKWNLHQHGLQSSLSSDGLHELCVGIDPWTSQLIDKMRRFALSQDVRDRRRDVVHIHRLGAAFGRRQTGDRPAAAEAAGESW